MRILHYSLGFPPERSGGLIRYTLDLMNQQITQGDHVYYLYPGHISFLSRKTYIKFDKKHKKYHFSPFSLVNSLPLPLFGGIRTPSDFMQPLDKKIYIDFLKQLRLDIIHIHTLMGLHREFFEAAGILGIKIVYTSHDYFGLAPEPTFYFQGKNYDNHNTVNQWCKIGAVSMSTRKLRMLQMPFYPTIRYIMHKLSFQKLIKLIQPKSSQNRYKVLTTDNRNAFKQLKQYYRTILSKIDFFHFNSQLALSVYRANMSLKNNYTCISITNSSIKKKYPTIKSIGEKMKIAYIGPYESYKGFFEFLKLPQLLGTKRYEYHIYGSNEKINLPAEINNHGRFNGGKLNSLYKNIDLVIVPSLCKETFGFITIEALNHGVRVLVSSNVGAKELLNSKFVFNSIKDVPQLVKNIGSYEIQPQKTMYKHYLEIKKIYKELL